MARPTSSPASFHHLVLLVLVGLLLTAPAHAGNVTLAWDANAETDLAGYIVSWGPAPGTYTGSVDVRQVVTFTVPNLTGGQRYYFAVQAYNTSGLTSPYSTEVSALVPSEATPVSVTSVTPAVGPRSGGTALSVTGTGFTAGTSVTVGGVAASAVTILSSTVLTCVTGAHALGVVDVVVTVPGQAAATAAGAFTYQPVPPGVTSVVPATGGLAGGTAVTVTGTGFAGAVRVLFDGVEGVGATVGSVTTVTVTTPAHAAGAVTVQVVNGDGGTTSVARAFTFVGDSEDRDGDGLPDAWETTYGLDPADATGANGATGDPDGDGASNATEHTAGTHPRGLVRRYFAEGISSSFFTTVLALANPGETAVPVVLQFFKTDGTTAVYPLTLAAGSRATLDARDFPSIADAAFSTTVESATLIVADRTVSWDSTGYGGHAETAVEAPATTWYLAEGATHSGFDLFYLLQNPTATAAAVEVRYLRPSGAPIVKTYDVPANSRYNIWVDFEDVALKNTDVSAVVTATNGVPIIVERSMYQNAGNQPFGAGHNSAGITTPATTWFLAEGATGDFFDMFVLVANPGETAATVTASYLLPSGRTVEKRYTVPATSRFNIWVDYEDVQLANTAVSTSLESTNGVPIIVERTMWWPGNGTRGWLEAHNAPGTTGTSSRWALAEGELGGAQNRATYVLLANTSTYAGAVQVTLLFEDGTQAAKQFTVAARSRFNVDVAGEFPQAMGKRFGAVIEGLGQTPVQLVVERAMYWDANGDFWAAGTDAVGTRLDQ